MTNNATTADAPLSPEWWAAWGTAARAYRLAADLIRAESLLDRLGDVIEHSGAATADTDRLRYEAAGILAHVRQEIEEGAA
jgi:hypothetical protein